MDVSLMIIESLVINNLVMIQWLDNANIGSKYCLWSYIPFDYLSCNTCMVVCGLYHWIHFCNR